jgi:hypothetical protein
VIVDARSGDVRVAEPFLHLGDVGLMIQGIGGGGRAQRVCADLEAKRGGIAAHQLVNAVRRNRVFGLAGAIVAGRAKQRAVLVLTMTGGDEVVMESALVPGCSGRYRVLPPLPDTRSCGTPLRACWQSFTFSLHSSSRRSA